ncbi:hypothetical protein K443DRAFT_408317 [Laccaria amethystina LaAM-08-1]|uniref:Uncharacterized protein n=1 Tax=Laccaria amethystina LaAM-08-1 TaxID=1095629 RepID=A0A0C9XA88_9AGAR|nr:hypothetical protein K443DRAFT_408317 [Laccaria amethystina LaAM-08-1]
MSNRRQTERELACEYYSSACKVHGRRKMEHRFSRCREAARRAMVNALCCSIGSITCRGEIKIILATPIVSRLLVLLQRMEYGPRSCGIVRWMVGKGARRRVRDDEDG